jgi:hypothetical protein
MNNNLHPVFQNIINSNPMFQPVETQQDDESVSFEIHWEKSGHHASKVLTGSLEDIRRRAKELVDNIKPDNYWSNPMK